MKNNQYEFTILRPGGNDTALVRNIVPKEERKRINDAIMSNFPYVEQVGFYSYNRKDNTGRLAMAGGEFCGNALRSLAYLLLEGKIGEINFNVFGTRQILKAGIRKKTAFAQIPTLNNFNPISKINENLWQVDLEGITHLIKPVTQKLSRNNAKSIAKKLLNQTKLIDSKPAAGVMFVREENSRLKIMPVVWVRDIKTFFYETACASGTAAVGIWNTRNISNCDCSFSAKQPSGKYIQVYLRKTGKNIKYLEISGQVEVLQVIKNFKIYDS